MEHGIRKRAFKKRRGHGGIASAVLTVVMVATTTALCAVVVVFLSLLPPRYPLPPSTARCDCAHYSATPSAQHCLPIIATVKVLGLTAVGCVAPVRAGRANKARGNDPINMENKTT